MRGKELIIAFSISLGIAIAILSLPDILEPIAHKILLVLGIYWPLAIFIIGIVHGLKPDEHTWPITVSYGIMQRNMKGAIVSTSVFAGALTLIWASLSALTGQLLSFFQNYNLDPVVDVIVGLTMIGVALIFIIKGKDKVADKDNNPDYKLIWIHGLAAAFGGDFIVVLLLTIALSTLISVNITFLIGLLFGIGSWIAQSIVVLLIYEGLVKGVKGNFQILAKAGRLSLLFLGIFMIGLGILSSLTG
ncbi:MAG: hypothetical protein QXY87_07530 [Saccharolobus sp.]|uniref:hypothetical protein n=1 Tax=Saccharolobus TaxID=2100760 RepID=UPI001F0FAB10|nr:hypothetical protein [Saccharolobus shibatae]MCH4815558.1 hypothetical protein [Saccharolobus shibatae]